MRKCLYIFSVALFVLTFFGQAFGQVKSVTMQQIQSLLQEKEGRTPAQQKMDSRLIQASKERRGLKMANGVDLMPAMVNADSAGRLNVDVDGDITETLLQKIKALGGEIIFPSKEFKTVRVRVNLSDLETIAGYSEVKFIQPAVLSRTVGNPKKKLVSATSIMPLPSKGLSTIASKRLVAEKVARVKKQIEKYVMMLGTGTINSQGDHPHRADDVRNTLGFAGQGIKIGVLSDSYNATGTAPASVASGNLPGIGNPLGNTTPVTVVLDHAGSTDEGQAMLQIVHDIAPKAQLFFATGDVSEASFASNIIALRNTYGCNIIIDDLGYFDEPAFSDGIVAQAVTTVTNAGAMYFSSAGNAGSLIKGTSSVFEGDFNDIGSLPFTGSSKTGGSIHNFGTAIAPINGDIIATPENTAAGTTNYYTINWSDAMGASGNDYDLFLVSAAGTIKASSTTTQTGTQNPYEQISAAVNTIPWVSGDRLVVFKAASAAVRAFHLSTVSDGGSTLSVGTTSSTDGHACAVGGFCVGATPAPAAYPNPFIASNKVETFSSDGPRRMFYNVDGTPVSPGNFTFASNGYVTRNKPDVTAADGVSTSLASFTPFYGTSAAAPHAGAIAALLLCANNTLSVKLNTTQIGNILTSTALDIETAGYDYNSGFGILQAYQAVQAVGAVPLPNISVGTNTLTEGSFSNGNGSLEPGETGNLVLQLNNSTSATATNVTATITSNTAGVTITKGTFNYGSIAGGGISTNTGVPFTFALSQSLACGSTISFQIIVTFGGGGPSPASATISTTLGAQVTLASIPSSLGTPTSGAGYTVVTGQQTGRIGRVTSGASSSCAAPLANPGIAIATGARQYDAYTFTNTTGISQCFTVTVTSSNSLNNIYTAAYNSAGFIPSSPNTNYLAEPAQTPPTYQYSFTVNSGANFTVVVHAVDSLSNPGGNEVGTAYTLGITYINCVAAPTCTPVSITKTTLPAGATNANYVQHITATGGSGAYVDTLSGNLPAGISFAGDSLSGIPTQAGTFAIIVKVTDPAGCPSSTATYKLFIAGDSATSVIATAGTPQTALPSQVFATALQATVKDASNVPLAGVNVMFNAPTSGASGTFTGGVTSVIVITNSSGVATAPTFTANSTNGNYTVTAAVNNVTPSANFSLGNVCPSTLVTTSADNGPGSLRYIIANACLGATIIFDPSVTAVALTSGEIPITQSVTINGNGANVTSISGGGLSRIFLINAATTSAVFINGLTLKNGKPQAAGVGTSNSSNGGGAILVSVGGTLTVNGCYFFNNDVSLTDNGEGGAIDDESTATIALTNCGFTNNVAPEDGGGVAHWGTKLMTLSNCTFTNNTANSDATGNHPDGWGGGLLIANQSGSNTSAGATLTNCTFYGNSANYGGGIFRYTGRLTMGGTIAAGGITTAGTVTNGRDVWTNGVAFTSTGYNLIQNTTGYTLTGITTGNQQGVDPKLLPLANYGGIMPTMLPMSSSPAINAANTTAPTLTVDQRGFARVTGGNADIGAVETNYASGILSGSTQSTAVSTNFINPLKTLVTESNNLIAGDSVYYIAPATGQSGTFPTASLSATVATDASGIATSPTFTANAISGTYNVTSSIGTAFTALNFVLTNNIATPVTFGTVTATVINCTALVQWETLTELNSKDFTVEYSTDGLHFNSLTTVPAKGNSTTLQVYKYLHTSLVQGANYYRIKQTDLDGVFTYSSVVIVANACNNAPIVAYPNPVKNNLTVVLPGTDKQTITITDAIGRRINQYIVNGGTQIINASSWAKGMYSLTVTKDGATTFVMKVIKD